MSAIAVSSSGELLIGSRGDCNLHIYNAEMQHRKSVHTAGSDYVQNVIWTPFNDIAYTSMLGKTVVIVSPHGEIRSQSKLVNPRSLSMPRENVIYLADYHRGVLQSIDNGKTWSDVFKWWSNTSGNCSQLVVVPSTDINTDNLWTLEKSVNGNWQLRVYEVNHQHGPDYPIWWEVKLPVPPATDLSNSWLTYDGHSSILMTDYINRAVHVWSVSGLYERQLLSPQDFDDGNKPRCLAVDSKRQLLYVSFHGPSGKDLVGLYELTYV